MKRLLRKDQKIDSKTLVRKCVQRYRFLTELTGDEEKIRTDTKRHHETRRVKEIEKRLRVGLGVK